MISLIVAADENNVIGHHGALPWKLPADMKFFRETTKGHPVIMGRKTYASIGRALPGRQNVVVTRQEDFEAPGCKVVNSLVDAIGVASMADGNDEIFVIGGGELYREVLPSADRVYLTRVHASVEGDTTFPELDPKLWKEIARHEHPADAENPQAMTFLVYEKK
jgi:dihydrofolate reductase